MLKALILVYMKTLDGEGYVALLFGQNHVIMNM